MAKSKSSVLLCCLAVFLAIYNEGQAQFLPFSLGDSDNDCYVQCPMECPQLNLNMVDCVVYCKMKCACPADDAECATKAMDKMQKAADERESAIGPEEEAAAESPASDAPSASESDEEATDGDLAFATEDGETSLSPEAMPPEIDTTSFVIEMDLSPTPSAGAPMSQDAEAPASQSGAAATPQSATAATPQSPAAPTPRGATAPTPQGAASPTSSQAAASPASDNAASPAPQVALTPNAPAPA